LTADPRLVPDAQLMDEITSDEMLELASLGAKVLHPRAVEIAPELRRSVGSAIQLDR
jgi:aspartate kinase